MQELHHAHAPPRMVAEKIGRQRRPGQNPSTRPAQTRLAGDCDLGMQNLAIGKTAIDPSEGTQILIRLRSEPNSEGYFRGRKEAFFAATRRANMSRRKAGFL